MNIEELAKKSGQSIKQSDKKYETTYLKFNGNAGMYSLYDNGTTVEIGNTIKYTILKKRRVLKSYSPKIQYFSTEHNSPNDTITVFKKENGKIESLGQNTAKAWREQIVTLKVHELLYVLYNDTVSKLEVKGSSLAKFYEYLNSLSEQDKYALQVETESSMEQAPNDAGFSYKLMTFKTTGESNMLSVEKYIEELHQALDSDDSQVENTGKSESPEPETVEDEVIESSDQDFDNF